MTEPQQVGWEIYNKFYPHNGIEALRHGDFRLVRLVTGMSTDEFVNGDDLTGSESGWIAVAFSQGHPEMTVEMVARMMDTLKIEDVLRVGFEIDEEPEQSPPDEGEDRSPSSSATTEPSSPEPATTTPPETPDASTPDTSGASVSRIGALG
jgi:hypothetical protein